MTSINAQKILSRPLSGAAGTVKVKPIGKKFSVLKHAMADIDARLRETQAPVKIKPIVSKRHFQMNLARE